MRIKWIFLVVIIIQVLGQGRDFCHLKEIENPLITIASGENYDLLLSDYMIVDDLTYHMSTPSDQQSDVPFSYMQRITRYGIINDEVIQILEHILKYKNKVSSYFCFIRNTIDNQTVYRLVKCVFTTDNIIYFDVQFIINREHCYKVIYIRDLFIITCKDDITNQLEIITFSEYKQKLQHTLISDVTIPPESKVNAKYSPTYLGVFIYKGRIDNNKYISEISSLFLFQIISLFYPDLMFFKQYEAHSQPDDFITDFDLYQELVFITRFKGGLTFRNLKISWSEEIKVNNFQTQLFGVHIMYDFLQIQTSQQIFSLMLWGENFLTFVLLKVSNINYLQAKGQTETILQKKYELKSETVYSRNVVSDKYYLIFTNYEGFQVFSINLRKHSEILLIYQGVVNSRLYYFSIISSTLLYEEQNVIKILDLQLIRIELVNLSETKNPQLLQFSLQKYGFYFDQIQCQDINIYYQVQPLDPTKIWPKFYKEKEKNVFILRYTKNELTIKFDFSKYFSGSALSLEDINFINKETKFTPQNFLVNIERMNKFQVMAEFVTLCQFNNENYLLQKIGTYISMMECDAQSSFLSCQKIIDQMVEDADLSNLVCQSTEMKHQFAYVGKLKHGFGGEFIHTYQVQFQKGQKVLQLYDVYWNTKGNILSIILLKYIQVFTILTDNFYTLNWRFFGYSEGNLNVRSLEVDCYKIFELVVDLNNFKELLFLPIIKYKNFVFQIIIEIYIIEESTSQISYLSSLLVGVTKKPTKERLQVQLTEDGIFILSVCDISEDEQSKQLLFIEKAIFLRKLLFKKEQQLQLKNIRTKIYPTFSLKKVEKMVTSKYFLYVYGSEIDAPTCIYIYRIYENQMDSLYHVIRPDIQSIRFFNVMSMMKDYETLIIFTNQLSQFIWLKSTKILEIIKSDSKQDSNLNDNEVIDIKMKSLIPKDNNKIHEFQIKLICTDCQSTDNQV
ncbi:unnamed protein product [Paramecium octaurelia]|uniref:Transmembrane protein n=1 Tax=Paramecium octaurelia TaxID=43137 RepID=A0A8S1XC10_PAROT|nr:unnamed protein product [Paramecium octaurelia]